MGSAAAALGVSGTAPAVTVNIFTSVIIKEKIFPDLPDPLAPLPTSRLRSNDLDPIEQDLYTNRLFRQPQAPIVEKWLYVLCGRDTPELFAEIFVDKNRTAHNFCHGAGTTSHAPFDPRFLRHTEEGGLEFPIDRKRVWCFFLSPIRLNNDAKKQLAMAAKQQLAGEGKERSVERVVETVDHSGDRRVTARTLVLVPDPYSWAEAMHAQQVTPALRNLVEFTRAVSLPGDDGDPATRGHPDTAADRTESDQQRTARKMANVKKRLEAAEERILKYIVARTLKNWLGPVSGSVGRYEAARIAPGVAFNPPIAPRPANEQIALALRNWREPGEFIAHHEACEKAFRKQAEQVSQLFVQKVQSNAHQIIDRSAIELAENPVGSTAPSLRFSDPVRVAKRHWARILRWQYQTATGCAWLASLVQSRAPISFPYHFLTRQAPGGEMEALDAEAQCMLESLLPPVVIGEGIEKAIAVTKSFFSKAGVAIEVLDSESAGSSNAIKMADKTVSWLRESFKSRKPLSTSVTEKRREELRRILKVLVLEAGKLDGAKIAELQGLEGRYEQLERQEARLTALEARALAVLRGVNVILTMAQLIEYAKSLESGTRKNDDWAEARKYYLLAQVVDRTRRIYYDLVEKGLRDKLLSGGTGALLNLFSMADIYPAMMKDLDSENYDGLVAHGVALTGSGLSVFAYLFEALGSVKVLGVLAPLSGPLLYWGAALALIAEIGVVATRDSPFQLAARFCCFGKGYYPTDSNFQGRAGMKSDYPWSGGSLASWGWRNGNEGLKRQLRAMSCLLAGFTVASHVSRFDHFGNVAKIVISPIGGVAESKITLKIFCENREVLEAVVDNIFVDRKIHDARIRDAKFSAYYRRPVEDNCTVSNGEIVVLINRASFRNVIEVSLDFLGDGKCVLKGEHLVAQRGQNPINLSRVSTHTFAESK
ncbi:MAG: hypothetical protein IPJ27_05535 [Candidatus Accumulibacter sp.]|uniref:Uncharacterized protein n=1 Tax=Candidatus Accumulibacter proximus TaxID=2954385 RepID=A0A935UG25_9PROT|nr:hypothetical protein [Candidatus Accumulibacter proximus]